MTSALRYRDFRLYWGGLVLSAFGSQFSNVATAWQIYELTDSALQIGLLGLVRGLPQIVLLLYGGVLADAVDRRRLMMATQATQLLVSAGLVAFTATGLISPPVLYVAAIIQAVAGSLDQPARQALVPNLVPREEITSAVALNSIQRTLGSIMGPSIAGIVLAFAGAAWCYAVDTASWIVLLAVLMVIRPMQTSAVSHRPVSMGALREGLEFVWGHPILLSLMVLDCVATFFGNQKALFPVFARDILNVGAPGLGLMYSASSIGALLGAFLVHNLPKRDWMGRWVLIGMTFFGVFGCGFAISTNFALSLVMLAGMGLTNTGSTILRSTINQIVTPDHLRGRVLAVNSVFSSSGPQLGQFESGAVASLWGAEMAAFTGGLLTVLVVPAMLIIPASAASVYPR